RVELHSRQPTGSRTYATSSGCTPDSGFTECRVVTGTIDREALIPGDQVVVVERATLSADGDKLTRPLEVEASGLTSEALSDFSGSATTRTTITPPSGSPTTGEAVSFPVSVASGEGVGRYTVRSVITTAPNNSGDPWGTSLTG